MWERGEEVWNQESGNRGPKNLESGNRGPKNLESGNRGPKNLESGIWLPLIHPPPLSVIRSLSPTVDDAVCFLQTASNHIDTHVDGGSTLLGYPESMNGNKTVRLKLHVSWLSMDRCDQWFLLYEPQLYNFSYTQIQFMVLKLTSISAYVQPFYLISYK